MRVFRLDRSTYVLSLQGRVTTERAGEIADELARLRPRRLIVDVTDVPELDPHVVELLGDADLRSELTVVARPRALPPTFPFRLHYALSDAVAETL